MVEIICEHDGIEGWLLVLLLRFLLPQALFFNEKGIKECKGAVWIAALNKISGKVFS